MAKRELRAELNKDELYWKQRSRVQYLKEGGRNTSFFHARAISRKKENHTKGITNGMRQWLEIIFDVVEEFYRNLFRFSNGDTSNLIPEVVETCITLEINAKLCSRFTTKESAFVPGRIILDNILVEDELCHYLKSSWNGFAQHLIDIVMNSATSVSFCFWINDSISDYFMPSRGLSNRGPSVNHLLYADNNLMFIKNSVHKSTRLKEVLKICEDSSNQKVNVDKSFIYFINDMSDHDKQQIKNILNMWKEPNLETYLGLPLIVEKDKTAALGCIFERVDKSVRGWTKNLLCCAHVAWSKLCWPRDVGGLGFLVLHLFNLALLAKHVWHLITNNDSLCFKVLSARYFFDGNILYANLGGIHSIIWHGILRA
ncbi:hypothetical protein GQ457_01G015890 [Hibiscus cannabinus]